MVEFIGKHYWVIIAVAAFLIFALIGYAVDSTRNKKNKESDLLNKPNDDVDVNQISETNVTEDVTSAPVMEETQSDDSMNMGN